MNQVKSEENKYCDWCRGPILSTDATIKTYHQVCWDRNKNQIEEKKNNDATSKIEGRSKMQYQKHEIARAALTGLLSNELHYRNVIDSCNKDQEKIRKIFAKDAYDIAEAMIGEGKHRDPNFDERNI